MVLFSEINDVPVISNLPLLYSFLLEENTPIGTTLFHIRVSDLDIGDDLDINGVYDPSSGSSYFNISSGKISYVKPDWIFYNSILLVFHDSRNTQVVK